MGLSGVSLWGSDIGGFFTLGAPQLTPELLMRWIQFGAVSGVMRTQANGFALPPRSRGPRSSTTEVLPVWRRYAKLRTQLYPYLAAADARVPAHRDADHAPPRRSPTPATRARRARRRVPVRARTCWPRRWSSRARRSATLLPAARPLGRPLALGCATAEATARRARRARAADEGRAGVTLPAPLDRAAAARPRGDDPAAAAADVDTLTGYGRQAGIVKLRGRLNRLTLIAFPRGPSSAALYRRERLRSSERRGRWSLRIRGVRKRRYTVQASLAALRARPFRPCRVTVGGRPLRRSAWTYRGRTRVLRVRFRARSTTLVVSRRCGARRRGR